MMYMDIAADEAYKGIRNGEGGPTMTQQCTARLRQ